MIYTLTALLVIFDGGYPSSCKSQPDLLATLLVHGLGRFVFLMNTNSIY